jgi:phosphoribosylanthranilate isomerase
MKVKICGITNLQDALDAVELGADALGFIFVKSSPRHIAPDSARHIISSLPPFVTPVGVFADSPDSEILETITHTGIDCVQLYGNDSSTELKELPVPIVKAFRVAANFDVKILQGCMASAFLLDTYVDGALGGTGKTFDWNVAVSAKAYGRVILAGGLTPDNIVEAMRTVQPYAADVNSGVESAPGKKDKSKLRNLFANIQIFNKA